MFHKNSVLRVLSLLITLAFIFTQAGVSPAKASPIAASLATGIDPSPPTQPVKLIFIHHSTGENLLRDDYGRLGIALKNNKYFVSDTNYGWGPNAIGDRTDIPNWTEWFRSADTPTYMNALFNESGQHSTYTRLAANPGGQNVIILFKSCFPNSNLEGNPNDPPSPSGWLTVGHAKWVYNQLLQYFVLHPDKLFVVITAPPVQDGTYAVNARAFNQWLMSNWLAGYSLKNVAVFDFYNVLTGPNNHHRYINGAIEHVFTPGMNTSYYPSGDDHPSITGSLKATTEFLPLLNISYHRWRNSLPPRVLSITRADPNPTRAASAHFTVRFSEAVTGVDSSDFTLTITGATLTGASISPTLGGSGSTYTVTAGTGSGSGAIRLDLIDNDSIRDADLNPLGGTGAGNGNFTAGQTYVVRPLEQSFLSVATSDGWVLESGENSSVGSTINAAATTFNLGDDAARKQYRGILSFATGAALPDNAIISAVTLKVKQQTIVGGGNPVTTFQGFMVDIKNGLFGTAALQATDFQTLASKSYGPFSTALVGGWYNINLTGASAYMNKLSTNGGLTQIRLRFKLDDNNNAVANYLSLFSGNAPAGSQPQLVITYIMP